MSHQRRPSPLRQWCIPHVSDFPPCFRFLPYFRKFFSLRGKFSQFYLFPQNFKISRFSSAKISEDLFWSLTRPTNFEFPPISAVSVHFSLFRGNSYFPLLLQISPPPFRKIYVILCTLRVFRFSL